MTKQTLLIGLILTCLLTNGLCMFGNVAYGVELPDLDALANAKDIELPALPWHLMDVWGNLAGETKSFERIDIDVEVSGDLSSEYNLYIAPIFASINDQSFYLGIQTNVNGWASKESTENILVGKGGIFSRWSKDKTTPIGLDYVDMFEDGLCQSAGYEGEFCSVRRPFDWTQGSYTFSLIKEESILHLGTTHTWVAFEIKDNSSDAVRKIGRLLFEGETLTLGNDYASFVEVYGTEKRIPAATISFGLLRIDDQEIGIRELTARWPFDSVNAAEITSQDHTVIVTIDPEKIDQMPVEGITKNIALEG